MCCKNVSCPTPPWGSLCVLGAQLYGVGGWKQDQHSPQLHGLEEELDSKNHAA